MNSSFSAILICYTVHVDEYSTVSLKVVIFSWVNGGYPQED